jgi:phosphorylcholine metabolism protein LicD
MKTKEYLEFLEKTDDERQLGFNKTQENRKPPSKKELLASYTSFMEILKELNIIPILFYGNLLGLYRENDFIDGDDDIDVLLTREQLKIVYEYCIKKGYDVWCAFYYHLAKYDEASFMHISQYHADIYLYKIIGNVIYIEWTEHSVYPLHDIFPLRTVYFHGFNVHIPSNTHKVITDTYGDNWNTPMTKSDYNWSAITKVVRNTSPYSLGYRYSILNSIKKIKK